MVRSKTMVRPEWVLGFQDLLVLEKAEKPRKEVINHEPVPDIDRNAAKRDATRRRRLGRDATRWATIKNARS